MKACPYCNQQIDDGANFCLYCMKTLNNKTKIAPIKRAINKRLYVIISAVLFFALLLGSIFTLPKKTDVTSSHVYLDDFTVSQENTSSETSSKNMSSKKSFLSVLFGDGNKENSSSKYYNRYTATSSWHYNETVTSQSDASSKISSTSSKESSSSKISSVSSEENSSSKVSYDSSVTTDSSSTSSEQTTKNGKFENMYYTIYLTADEPYVEINGFDYSKTIIDVPETIEGYPVKSITESVLANRDDITEVSLPPLKSIPKYAFRDCDRLKTVRISLTYEKLIGRFYIYEYAFADCDSLSAIYFDNSTNTSPSIYPEYGAFYNCTQLKDLYFTSHPSLSINNVDQCNYYFCKATLHY